MQSLVEKRRNLTKGESMESQVVRGWRKKAWWRTFMFAMPIIYFLVGASLTAVNNLTLTGTALIIVGAWLGVYAHSHAYDRVHAYVATADMAQVQFDRVISAFDNAKGLIWVYSAQEYGDPFFPRRVVVVVDFDSNKTIVLYDWIKNRYYRPGKLKSKRFATLEDVLGYT